MRIILPIIAGALLSATPALAQNQAAPANAMDANASAPAATNATDNGVNAVAAADVTAAPLPVDNADMAAAPAPEHKHGFPWGVLGLIGLLGLIPRTRGNRS